MGGCSTKASSVTHSPRKNHSPHKSEFTRECSASTNSGSVSVGASTNSGSVSVGSPGSRSNFSEDTFSSSTPISGITPSQLAEFVPQVMQFDGKRFVVERKLEDAIHNHGQVLLMLDTKPTDGFTRIAMKQMPNDWVCKSSRHFDSKHPAAKERPWQDFSCVSYLNSIGYPYACKMIGIFRDNTTTYVATSLCTEGDMFSWSGRDPQPGPERLRALFPITVQVCSAVQWLHDVGIVHRDLSLENILLTELPGEGYRAKIIDFGMSMLKRRHRFADCGKSAYQAPEMHSLDEYDGFLTDTFSLGFTFYSAAAKDYPWSGTKVGMCKVFDFFATYGLRALVTRRKLRSPDETLGLQVIMDAFDENFFEFVERLMCVDPSKRLTLGEEAWASEGGERRSVWQTAWMEGHQTAQGALFREPPGASHFAPPPLGAVPGAAVPGAAASGRQESVTSL